MHFYEGVFAKIVVAYDPLTKAVRLLNLNPEPANVTVSIGKTSHKGVMIIGAMRQLAWAALPAENDLQIVKAATGAKFKLVAAKGWTVAVGVPGVPAIAAGPKAGDAQAEAPALPRGKL